MTELKQGVWYAIKYGSMFLADGQGSWHWKLEEAWLLKTMQEALPLVLATPGAEMIFVQVIQSFHEIGPVR